MRKNQVKCQIKEWIEFEFHFVREILLINNATHTNSNNWSSVHAMSCGWRAIGKTTDYFYFSYPARAEWGYSWPVTGEARTRSNVCLICFLWLEIMGDDPTKFHPRGVMRPVHCKSAFVPSPPTTLELNDLTRTLRHYACWMGNWACRQPEDIPSDAHARPRARSRHT